MRGPLQGDRPFGQMLMWNGRALWQGPTMANALSPLEEYVRVVLCLFGHTMLCLSTVMNESLARLKGFISSVIHSYIEESGSSIC